MDAFYSSRQNLTMKPIVEALINGTSPDEFIRTENSNSLATKNENLFLLAGHLDISDLDAQISLSLRIASGVPATKNIPGNLPKILQEIAKKEGMDYLIYDLSPNVGGLNEVILMSSDYFIIPTSPDYFCLQAISSLEKNIIKWHTEIQRFKKDNKFENKNFSIRNQPLFLGTIQQKYRPRNDRPAKSFKKWMDAIRDLINKKLVSSLAEIGCVVEKSKIDQVVKDSKLEPYDLAHVPDFNSLIAISQQLSKPVFALTDEDIKEIGKVFGHAENTMKASRDLFLETFTALAERVQRLIG